MRHVNDYNAVLTETDGSSWTLLVNQHWGMHWQTWAWWPSMTTPLPAGSRTRSPGRPDNNAL